MYEGELCGVQTQACGIGFAFKSRMTVKGVAVNGATEPFGAMHTQLVRAACDRAQAHESFRSSRSLLRADHDKFCGRRLSAAIFSERALPRTIEPIECQREFDAALLFADDSFEACLVDLVRVTLAKRLVEMFKRSLVTSENEQARGVY